MCSPLRGEAAVEAGVSMTQHALRWALAQPGVVSALIGVKRTEQIDRGGRGEAGPTSAHRRAKRKNQYGLFDRQPGPDGL